MRGIDQQTAHSNFNTKITMTKNMKAALFVELGRIVLDEKPVPEVGANDALIRITTTTICGTDIHILKGEYPVEKGLTIGHEPVGIIEKLGSNVRGYKEGERVIAGAICPSGYSNAACASEIRLTARRPSTFWCRMQRLTFLRLPTH